MTEPPVTRVKRTTDGIVDAMVDDDLLFVNAETGRFYCLRDTALRIWQCIGENGWTSLDELNETLCAEFDVGEERCRRDVAVLVQELEDAGFIEVAREAAAP